MEQNDKSSELDKNIDEATACNNISVVASGVFGFCSPSLIKNKDNIMSFFQENWHDILSVTFSDLANAQPLSLIPATIATVVFSVNSVKSYNLTRQIMDENEIPEADRRQCRISNRADYATAIIVGAAGSEYFSSVQESFLISTLMLVGGAHMLGKARNMLPQQDLSNTVKLAP